MKIFYKFLRNNSLPQPFGRVKVAKFAEVPTPFGPAVVPVFAMDEIHALILAEETPATVTRVKGMSAKMYSALCDDAVSAALENRKSNLALKSLFHLYCLEGILEEVQPAKAAA